MEYLYGEFDPKLVENGLMLCKKKCSIKARGDNELYDDYMTLAYVALTKALKTFDTEKAKWSTYLYKCIDNEIYSEYRKVHVKKWNSLLSTDAVLMDDDDGNNFTLLDLYGEDDKSFDSIVSQEMYNYVTDVNLTKTQQKIYWLLVNRPELTQIETAKLMGFSRAYYCSQLSIIRNKMKNRLKTYNRV